MKYGYFDDLNKEYVIETPRTPLPWINYLGTNGFFSLISNTSGGYCFYKDAKHRRILRYRYNNIPADNGGRYFYINDNGDCWTPSYMPMKKELDFYECRHGMGYTKITGERNGVRVEQTAFVPVDDNCEIHRIKLRAGILSHLIRLTCHLTREKAANTYLFLDILRMKRTRNLKALM